MNYFNGDVRKGVGISFKPNRWYAKLHHYTLQHLLEAGAIVKAYDPIAIKEAKHHFSDTISYCEDQYMKHLLTPTV
jgi:UDPglucose 6-dehydrogenase